MLIWPFVVLCLLVTGLGLYLKHPKFGRLPEGARLERITRSPHYIEGTFRNLEPFPDVTEDTGLIKALARYLFSSTEGRLPPGPVPAAPVDFAALEQGGDVIIWLGHSSFFIQMSGKRILVDPVFSPYASPIWFANRAFTGTTVYGPEDMPDIDYLLISHDHWDHLDYQTVLGLKSKVKKVICPLGVGANLEHWGYRQEDIFEGDWNDAFVSEALTVHILPARHFSGRLLTRNKTLWAAFALVSQERKIFFSGDGGYGEHFQKIGNDFHGFDAVLLDTGQYDPGWRYVHMNPEQAVQAAIDLRAQSMLPAHTGKFSIAYHTWDDPFIRVVKASHNRPFRLLTPTIGQILPLDGPVPEFFDWWTGQEMVK